MIRLVLFIFISFQISSIYSDVKYESVHDETYWFPNDELLMEGFHIGTVRSNLVWMDRMSVFLQETDCDGAPILYMTLSTSNVRKDYPEFDFSSLEGKFLELGFNFDDKVFEKYEVAIFSALELQNNNHAVNLWFEEFPIPFYVPWDVLTVKIMENDPNRKYFDLPERQYRMNGFPDVFLHMTEECKKTQS